jgi:uncharacterized protein (DUF1778 family)
MTTTRIQVYTDEETKRRIALAAAKQDVPVTQYCLEAIKQQLAEDDMLERETIEIAITPPREDKLIADLRALRERIRDRRGGALIPLDIVEQVRQERDDELIGLR